MESMGTAWIGTERAAWGYLVASSIQGPLAPGS